MIKLYKIIIDKIRTIFGVHSPSKEWVNIKNK